MKKLSILIFLVVSLSSGYLHSTAFDRRQIHETSLSGLNLRDRAAEGVLVLPLVQSLVALPTDLKLSESHSPALFNQDGSCLRILRDGSWVAVWQDNRFGSEKIFLQRLDSLGTPIGSNQLVAGSPLGANYVEPKIAVDTSNRIYLFYRDRTDGFVIGTRLTSSLAVDLPAFLVNDTSAGAFAGPFDFDIYPDGRMVVAWENYSTLGSTISLKIFDPSGGTFAGPLTVNSDGGSVSHWVPKVAVQPSGGFLVAWEDYRSGNADILARLYLGSGSPVAGEFGIVPPGPAAFPQYAPEVAYSSVDKYVIGWLDRRLGQEVYAQLYNPTTGLVGVNTLVSAGDTLTTNWDLNLAISPEGRIMATWGAFGPQNSILSRRFAAGLVPLGTPQPMNMANIGRRWSPSAQFRTSNRFGIAWTEYAVNNPDIHFMLFDTLNAHLLADEKRLNDDLVGSPSIQPCLVNTSAYDEVCVFTSSHDDEGDIYAQAFSHTGVLQSVNQRVNEDTGSNLQSEPWVCASGGSIMVTWVDSRAINGVTGQHIFGRYGSPLAVFSSPEFVISDSSQIAAKSAPHAVITSLGSGLVAWFDQRDGRPQVYGRWLASSGALIGPEFLISTPAMDLLNTDLQIGLDSLNRFYVAWLDLSAAPPVVKGKWYDSTRAPGGSFSYSPLTPGRSIAEMSSAVNDSGQISIAWVGVDSLASKLYLTVIDRTGGVLVPPFAISDSATARPSEPSISVDQKGYSSITWVDRRDINRRVYYQILDAQLNPMGGNQPVSTLTPEFMTGPTTFASYGRAWFAWVDPRQDGLNIYGNTIVYLPTDIPDNHHGLPTAFSLSQNYPNPFNPSTEIAFTLPAHGRANLTVYNLLGERVRVVADAEFAAGVHTIQWDGTDGRGHHVASGIYFYRLTSGSLSQTKKMLLLK